MNLLIDTLKFPRTKLIELGIPSRHVEVMSILHKEGFVVRWCGGRIVIS